MADQEEPARPLTVEERRQRRLAKILGNSEGRINRILNNGSDENGPRLPPAIEGGEGYTFLADPTTNNEVTPASSHNNCQESLFSTGFANSPAFNYQTTPPTAAAAKFDVALVAFVLGLASRTMMLYTGPVNIGILWAIFYVTLVARYSAAGLNNQTRNELVAMFQAVGNGTTIEKIMNAGFMLIEFIQTTITFAASFILAHFLLEVYDFSSDYQIVV